MDFDFNKLFLCVSLSVSLSRFYSLYLIYYVSDLIKFDENVGTSVRLILSKFHKTRFSVDIIMSSFLFILTHINPKFFPATKNFFLCCFQLKYTPLTHMKWNFVKNIICLEDIKCTLRGCVGNEWVWVNLFPVHL